MCCGSVDDDGVLLFCDSQTGWNGLCGWPVLIPAYNANPLWGVSVKYGCWRHCTAVNRSFGLKRSICSINDTAATGASRKTCRSGVGMTTGKRTFRRRASWCPSSHDDGEGEPMMLQILNSWSLYDRPGKSGLQSSNSAKITPHAQMSTGEL